MHAGASSKPTGRFRIGKRAETIIVAVLLTIMFGGFIGGIVLGVSSDGMPEEVGETVGIVAV